MKFVAFPFPHISFTPAGLAQHLLPSRGICAVPTGDVDPGGWKYVGGVGVCFDPLPKNVTFFHSKALSDNSASFTSSRMKDLCYKYKLRKVKFTLFVAVLILMSAVCLVNKDYEIEGKTNFWGAWNSLVAWPVSGFLAHCRWKLFTDYRINCSLRLFVITFYFTYNRSLVSVVCIRPYYL